MVVFGGVVSSTVTSKEASPVLPAWSVAEQVTSVVSMGKVSPDSRGLQVGVMAPSTVSLALGRGLKVTTAPAKLVASLVMSPGTVTTGGVVSSGAQGTRALTATSQAVRARLKIWASSMRPLKCNVAFPGGHRLQCVQVDWL